MYSFCVGVYVCANVLLCTHSSLCVWKSEDRLVGPLSPLVFGSLGLVFGPVNAAEVRMGVGPPWSGSSFPVLTSLRKMAPHCLQLSTSGGHLGYFLSRGFWILPCLA